MTILKYDAFKRSIAINGQVKKYNIFLGAGASIESGVKSAYQCIWDWKKVIYDSNNSEILKLDICNDRTRQIVQKWLDQQGIYPANNDPSEYSYYIEEAYPQEGDRKEYFASILNDKKPSIGYNLLLKLAEKNFFEKVWTTNFDDMLVRAGKNSDFTILEVALDSTDRVNIQVKQNQLMIIKLHGDYKYSKLKNTDQELASQNKQLADSLELSLRNNDVIVIGYSGRDKSVMECFTNALQNDNCKNIYWCGMENEPNNYVLNLIEEGKKFNKDVYYIKTPGFDTLINDLCKIIGSNDEKFLSEIEDIKSKNINFNEIGSFEILKNSPKALVKSNILYCKVQSNCNCILAPKIDIKELRQKLKRINEHIDICAEIHGGNIYYIGDYSILKEELQLNVVADVLPITLNSTRQYPIKKIMNQLIVKCICKNNKNLKYSRNIIYDLNSKKNCYKRDVYEGVKLELNDDGEYNYVSVLPVAFFNKDNLDKSTIKKINDSFFCDLYGNKPNKYFSEYIEKWKKILLEPKGRCLIYSNDSIKVVFSDEFAYAGVVNANRKYKLDAYDQKKVRFDANEVDDPLINFLSKDYREIKTDFHPMRGLINNMPYDNVYKKNDLTTAISIGVVCPEFCNQKFYSFLNKLNNRQEARFNTDYLITYPGFLNIYKIHLHIPYYTDPLWKNYNFEPCKRNQEDSKNLYDIITKQIEKINNLSPESIVMIYIPDKYETSKSFESDYEKFDLHNQIKAYCVQKGIATQFINEKTLIQEDVASVCWTLSLALYVKSGRIPWTIGEVVESKTAYVGLGYSINKCKEDKNVVLGCSHIFSGDGQALKYKLSKVQNPQYDYMDRRKENPFLTEEEAYDLGCRINDICNKSFSVFPQRVVIHKRTPFKESEIKGLKKSLLSNGVKELELIEINYAEHMNFIQLNQNLTVDNYPIKRGLTIKLSDNTALVYTHGVAKSVKSEYNRYVLGGKSIPKPLFIRRYAGNTSLLKLSEEIMALTRMNWNNFNLYSKLPCTIESSNYIAQIGYLLTYYDDANFDQRFFM